MLLDPFVLFPDKGVLPTSVRDEDWYAMQKFLKNPGSKAELNEKLVDAHRELQKAYADTNKCKAEQASLELTRKELLKQSEKITPELEKIQKELDDLRSTFSKTKDEIDRTRNLVKEACVFLWGLQSRKRSLCEQAQKIQRQLLPTSHFVMALLPDGPPGGGKPLAVESTPCLTGPSTWRWNVDGGAVLRARVISRNILVVYNEGGVPPSSDDYRKERERFAHAEEQLQNKVSKGRLVLLEFFVLDH